MRGTIFFVEERLIHAVGIALHGERPVFQMREEKRRDADVVIDHLAFGESGFRVKDFVQIRNRQLLAFHDQLSFIAHESNRSHMTYAKKRSGESIGCGLQMRATQCSQLSWPLRISISTRRK